MKFLLLSIAVLFTGLMSNSVSASAQYPAAYFQPKVIYIAEGVVSNASVATALKSSEPEKNQADPRYPAAYFEPKVIYPVK